MNHCRQQKSIRLKERVGGKPVMNFVNLNRSPARALDTAVIQDKACNHLGGADGMHLPRRRGVDIGGADKFIQLRHE